MEGSGDMEGFVRVRREAPAAEELLLSNEGSGSGGGLGLGSGVILSESGSGIDGMDPSKLEAEEEMSVVDNKNVLLQAENVLPVTSKYRFRSYSTIHLVVSVSEEIFHY